MSGSVQVQVHQNFVQLFFVSAVYFYEKNTLASEKTIVTD